MIVVYFCMNIYLVYLTPQPQAVALCTYMMAYWLALLPHIGDVTFPILRSIVFADVDDSESIYVKTRFSIFKL